MAYLSALRPRQLLFIAEYQVDLNPTAAAKRAGYKDAQLAGSRLLAQPVIRAEIERRIEARVARIEITADKVLQELAKIGFSNMRNYTREDADGNLVPSITADTSADDMAAISEFTVEQYVEGRGEDAQTVKRTKFKLYDKRGALNDLGRHLGIFNDKLQLTGPNGGPVQAIVATMDAKQAAEVYAEMLVAPVERLALEQQHAAANDAADEEDDE